MRAKVLLPPILPCSSPSPWVTCAFLASFCGKGWATWGCPEVSVVPWARLDRWAWLGGLLSSEILQPRMDKEAATEKQGDLG